MQRSWTSMTSSQEALRNPKECLLRADSSHFFDIDLLASNINVKEQLQSMFDLNVATRSSPVCFSPYWIVSSVSSSHHCRVSGLYNVVITVHSRPSAQKKFRLDQIPCPYFQSCPSCVVTFFSKIETLLVRFTNVIQAAILFIQSFSFY